jgi:hypothetical protein
MSELDLAEPEALDVAAYQAATGASRERAEAWARAYAAAARTRFGVANTFDLTLEQSEACTRDADQAVPRSGSAADNERTVRGIGAVWGHVPARRVTADDVPAAAAKGSARHGRRPKPTRDCAPEAVAVRVGSEE